MVEIKFATETSDRELLGRPVARYSDVFVFNNRRRSRVGTPTGDRKLLLFLREAAISH